MDTQALIFWLVQIVFVPWFIRDGWPKTKKSTVFIKMVASTAFVLFGVFMLRSVQNTAYGTKILIGLICGWVGDVFLTLGPFLPEGDKKAENTITILGGIAFLAGHIFYIISFFSVSERKTALFLVLFVITYLLLIVAKQVLKLQMGSLTIPVILYGAMVTLMFTAGVVAGLSAGIPVLCVGAGLFLLSDLTLGTKTFAPKYNTLTARILYITAYYTAQMLLVHSMALA